MTIDELIKKETLPQKTQFWGSITEFTPYLAETQLGDGQKLAFINSINSRPHYWLVRVDTNQDLEDFEALLEIIEDECGQVWDKDDETGEEIERDYPAISWGGGTWGFVDE